MAKAVALMAETTADEVPAEEEDEAEGEETEAKAAKAPKAKAPKKPKKKPERRAAALTFISDPAAPSLRLGGHCHDRVPGEGQRAW